MTPFRLRDDVMALLREYSYPLLLEEDWIDSPSTVERLKAHALPGEDFNDTIIRILSWGKVQ